jgi:glycosyltransferase involved in cell wall biosynthesis
MSSSSAVDQTIAASESVVIYTHSMLEGSMTFIKSHAEALNHYRAVYVGAHRDHGIPLPADRTYVLNEGTTTGLLREALFRKWGWAPGLVADVRRHNPKVVHAHFGTSGPAGLALAERLGVPLVITFHGYDATRRASEVAKSRRGRELLRSKDRLIERTGVFIAVSEFIRQRLIEQGYPERKIVLHRNGIDVDAFKPPARREREPIVLFVGRFVEKKGALYLLEAARVLQSAGVRFKLVMIGAGPLERQFRDFAVQNDIPCVFTGFLDIEGVRSWLGRARVVAVPSVTAQDGDSEGLPTILLEAQAMETPVVATFHSGIPEGVINGATAELVGERDVTTLAEKLRTFLDSPQKAADFGAAGRDFVRQSFNLLTQVRGLEALYRDVRRSRGSS